MLESFILIVFDKEITQDIDLIAVTTESGKKNDKTYNDKRIINE